MPAEPQDEQLPIADPEPTAAAQELNDDELAAIVPLQRVKKVLTALEPMQRADLLPPPEPAKVKAVTTLVMEPWSPPSRKKAAGDMSQFGRTGARTPK
jgi:hypothetical protein